jgi:predicted dehydrogenase
MEIEAMRRRNKRLKVAFLGGGVDSAVGQAHRIALAMDRRFELVAGCFSRYPNINSRTSEEYGVPSNRTYATLGELIKNEKNKVDSIIILTPTPDHRGNVVQCIKADVPVICEKAIATSVRDCVQIQKLVRKNHGFLVVTYNYTGYPMLRELRKCILERKLGKIEQIHIEMPQEGFIKINRYGKPQKPQDWRLRDGALPTVSLDLGVHLHHLIDFLTNEKPLRVVATQHRFGSFKHIVDNVICLATYTHNMVCNVWYSKTALGHRNGLRIRVYGKEGSAEWSQMDPELLYVHDRLGNQMKLDRASTDVKISSDYRYNRFKAGHPAGYIEAFANHYWDIADCLSGYMKTKKFKPNQYVFGIDKAKEGLIFLEAIKKSSIHQKWVRLNHRDSK